MEIEQTVKAIFYSVSETNPADPAENCETKVLITESSIEFSRCNAYRGKTKGKMLTSSTQWHVEIDDPNFKDFLSLYPDILAETMGEQADPQATIACEVAWDDNSTQTFPMVHISPEQMVHDFAYFYPKGLDYPGKAWLQGKFGFSYAVVQIAQDEAESHAE